MVKDHIRGRSTFLFYRDGDLWFKTDDTGFEFPIPVNDLGHAAVNVNEKSLILMRYIRKWIDVLDQKTM